MQDKAEITHNDALIGEITVCLQCMPAFRSGVNQPSASTPVINAPEPMPQKASVENDLASILPEEEVEETPLVADLSDDDYDNLIASADSVVDLFG